MNSLSKTLNVLFHETDVTRVIEKFLSPSFCDVCAVVDEECFVETLQRSCKRYTLDQDDHLYEVLRTKWMKSKKDNDLCYSESDTIFNVLLHFSLDVLKIHNGNPICRFKKLLRFHELSSYIQEDTITCAYYASWCLERNVNVHDFSWPMHIDHDLEKLNVLLQKELADIHFHLKGSSANFDLNWLCLMNNVTNLEEQLDELKSGDEFKRMAFIAASIRLYLFSYYYKNEFLSYEDLTEIIRYKNLDQIRSKVESRLILAKEKSYLNNYFNDYIDYTLTRIDNDINLSKLSCPQSIFAGERWLLFCAFKDIYETTQNNNIHFLFYVYLLIKNKFYHKLVQTNNAIGFGNFNNYERLKELFTDKKDIYKALVPIVAIGLFVKKNPKKRYVEARIAPKNDYEQFCDTINDLYNQKANESWGWGVEKWNYDILLHFIKEKEDREQLINGQERHFHLRDKVRNQTNIILKYKNSISELSSLPNKIVGIDAANSELYARPEIFAQAFRCLRNPSRKFNVRPVRDFCMTYHVGEDFHDLVDGLRAIDEVLIFMEFDNGDRLGHALSLKTEVKTYYENRQYSIAIPKQILLDNLVWLYVKLKRIIQYRSRILTFIEEQFGNYFDEIFGSDSSSKYTINDYYKSWLLRGDSPHCYSKEELVENCENSVEPWQASAFCGNAEVCKARNYSKARILNYLYQYDHDVRRKGWDCELFEIDKDLREDWVYAVKLLQDKLVDNIKYRGIHIECNPTSNFKIGEISQYKDHPIFKFHGVTSSENGLSVSVNTDDSGVFSTSLEREYSLLACAYLKENDNCQYDIVLKWLNQLRKEGCYMTRSRNCDFNDEEDNEDDKIKNNLGNNKLSNHKCLSKLRLLVKKFLTSIILKL